MKLALHIGTARTGTTTLQVWFAGNRAGLGEQGICYPTSPGVENHRHLMVYALEFAPSEPVLAEFGIHSPDDHEAFRSQLRTDLAREVEASRAQGHRVWLMSSEHLHSRIATPAMITRLHALLKPHFDDITVYLHLRPQVELLISNATQRARGGRPVNRAELTRPSVSGISNYFNYNKFVTNWEGVFGADNLRLVPYRTIPDMTGFMIDQLQIDARRLSEVIRVNLGLDWRTLALANAVHAGFAGQNLGNAPPFHLDDMPGSDRLQMGRLVAQEVQARFDDSNTKLAKRRKDITVEDLTPDWSQHDETGNLSVVEAPCLFAPQLAHMVRRLAQDSAMERWRRHIAEGRVAALTGNAEALDRAKREAQAAAAELDALGVSQNDDFFAPLIEAAGQPG